MRRIGAQGLDGRDRNAQREEEHGLQHAHDRISQEIGGRTDEGDAAEAPCHERRGGERGDETHDGSAGDRPAHSSPSPRHDAPNEHATRHERRGTGDAQLPAQVEHRLRLDERHHRTQREDRPGARRTLAQSARGEHAEHHRGSHGGRRRADRRDVDDEERERRDARGCAWQSQRGAEELESERDDAHVEAGHAEHVHQPRVGIAVALLAVDRAHVGDDERSHQRRVRAEDAVDACSRPRAHARRHRVRSERAEAGVSHEDGAIAGLRSSRQLEYFAWRAAPVLDEHGGAPPTAQGGDRAAGDVARRDRTLDAQLPAAHTRERRRTGALVRGGGHRHEHTTRRDRRDATGRPTTPSQRADRQGGGEQGDERSLAFREQEAGEQSARVRERAPRNERHRADIARVRRRASSGVFGAARNAARPPGYPAIGSGWRSRTTAPVNVEPVVPVSSTVR